MPRPKSKTTLALEKIAIKSGLSLKYLRELVAQGLPLTSTSAAQNWLADRPDKSPASSSMEELRREKIRLIRLQSQKAELELSVRRGEFISRAENIESDAKIGQAVRAFLAVYEREIPQLCFGATLAESQKRVREKSRELQSMLADLQSDYWKNRPLSQ